MNDELNDSNGQQQSAETEKALRVLWMILIPVFALIAVYDLVRWTQDKDSARGIFSPFGMIFLGASMLIRQRRLVLSKILLGVALLLVVAGLILTIIY